MTSRLVNKQFNSPIHMYSPENIADTLNKQSQILANGAVGIDFHTLAKPGHLANSAVLRMLEEEETRQKKGFKRVAWPPPPEPELNIPVVEENVPVQVNTPQYTHAKITPSTVIHPEPIRSWESQIGGRPTPTSISVGQPATVPAVAQPVAPVYTFRPVQFTPPPSVIKLRPTPPIEQPPPPVFDSQPAAIHDQGGLKMRGDEKWPPATVKQAAAEENEARKALAKGPAVRPRKVKKDYSSFFAQNALNSNYPGYRAPPGTQHYIEEGTSQF